MLPKFLRHYSGIYFCLFDDIKNGLIVFLISFADQFCSVLLTQHSRKIWRPTTGSMGRSSMTTGSHTHTGIGTTAKYSAIKTLEQTLGFFSSCDRFKSYDSYEML